MNYSLILCYMFISCHVQSWFLSPPTNTRLSYSSKKTKPNSISNDFINEKKAKLYMVSTPNESKLSPTIDSKILDQSNNQNQPFQPYIPPLKNYKYRINDIIPVTDIESIRMRYIQVATEDLAQECKTMITKGT